MSNAIGIPVRSDGNPLTRTLLVAPDYPQARAWAMAAQVRLAAPNITYVSSEAQMMGRDAREYDLVTYRWASGAALASMIQVVKVTGPWRKEWFYFDTNIEPDIWPI